jgi:amino acid transporter
MSPSPADPAPITTPPITAAPAVPAGAGGPLLRRCLGPLAITAQAVATVGLTITAVINIPEALAAGAGAATWLCYAIALLAIVLVSETLVLFREHPARASGIGGYVAAGLGPVPTALACWALLLGYGAVFIGCLAFFSAYLAGVLQPLGLPLPPLLGFLAGGGLCLELARRDVRLSTTTMLITEALSVLVVMGLCVLVLVAGGAAAADPAALAADLRLDGQLQAGLMIAVLSFIGFESAANLGEEATNPQRAVPMALRWSVLLAGAIFLGWALVLAEGLSWLTPALRAGVDPIGALAQRLGQPLAGHVVHLGATLCLFGTCLGSLTALGRLGYTLAGKGVLPRPLQGVHPRFRTPSAALAWTALPALLLGGGLVLAGQQPQGLYAGFGGFAVLAFLLVYGMVAVSALRRSLPAVSARRRWLVAGTSLAAVVAVSLGYLSGLIHGQQLLLWIFLACMLLGWLLVRRPPASAELITHP